MPKVDAGATKDFSGLTRWELNVFLAMSALAGAFLMFIVSFLIPRLLAPVLELPQVVWFGLGLLFLWWSLYPALRTQARLGRPSTILPWQRYLVGSLIGSLVGALVFAGLQTWMGLS